MIVIHKLGHKGIEEAIELVPNKSNGYDIKPLKNKLSLLRVRTISSDFNIIELTSKGKKLVDSQVSIDITNGNQDLIMSISSKKDKTSNIERSI